MVSLWDTLTVISGCTAFGAAMAAAKSSGPDPSRIAIGALAGGVMAIGSIAIARVAGKRAFDAIEGGRLGPRAESKYLVVYAAAAVWIIVAAILSARITLLVVRLAIS